MGTTHRHWLGIEELLAMGSFLVTVALGAWLLPGAWLSGVVIGLGVGLVVAAAVHLHAVRVTLPTLLAGADARETPAPAHGDEADEPLGPVGRIDPGPADAPTARRTA